MIELSVKSNSPAAITAALKKIKEMTSTGAMEKSATVHIILESGIYKELVKYNLSNPLIMEAAPGVMAEDCVIQAENCEAFNKGIENRGVFVIGPNATKVTLKNITIENTHLKSNKEGLSSGDCAEAFVWNNTDGILYAQGLRIIGRQNTLFVKGYTWFEKCYVSGDVDYIYGNCNLSYFEDCSIHTREDNRGDYAGFAVKSLAIKNQSGFVFNKCTFTADKRKKADLYVIRTAGKGSATMMMGWDSAAFINCKVSDLYSEEFEWDDDHTLTVYPRATVKIGWREYNTIVVSKNGEETPADTFMRNVKAYTMNDDDFYNNYSSRYLILKDTPLVSLVD